MDALGALHYRPIGGYLLTQLVVGATSHLGAVVINKNNFIATPQNQRRSGSNNRGASGALSSQIGGNIVFSVRIKRASGLQQHQHGGIGCQGTGQSQTLTLTARNIAGLLIQKPIQATHRIHQVIAVGQVQSLLRAGLKLAGQISNRACGYHPRIGVPLLGHQLQGALRLGLGGVITQHRLVERAGKSLGGGR